LKSSWNPRSGEQSTTSEKEKGNFEGGLNERNKNSEVTGSQFSCNNLIEMDLFCAAIKMSLDGIIIGDLKGYINDVNDAVVKLYGAVDKGEFVGRHIVEFLAEGDRERAMRDSLDSLKSGQGRTSEYLAISKSGKEVPIEVTVAFVRDEKGQRIGFVDIIRNLSNRKKNEEELKKANRKMELMNEKLRVLGGLGRHDILNKLLIINSNIFLAKKNGANMRALEAIENASNQIRSILQFSKEFELLGAEELKYIDVSWAVKEAVTLASDLKGIRILNECSGLTVLADSLLTELFHNLIDNTLKYGEKTTQIRVGCEEMDGQLNLVFEDDGVGISSEMKPKLFTRGFGKGTGLGLFLINRTVEFYGWQVQEAGVEGKGALFVFTIPQSNGEGKDNYRLES
jgi:PAS domain S-box-containing protein